MNLGSRLSWLEKRLGNSSRAGALDVMLTDEEAARRLLACLGLAEERGQVSFDGDTRLWAVHERAEPPIAELCAALNATPVEDMTGNG